MKTISRWWKIACAAVVAAATFVTDFDLSNWPGSGFLVPDAQAVIGRPLTPLSFAGVARRTTRRVIRRSAIYVAALPPACPSLYIDGGLYYQCGGNYYEPYGTQYVIVYID